MDLKKINKAVKEKYFGTKFIITKDIKLKKVPNIPRQSKQCSRCKNMVKSRFRPLGIKQWFCLDCFKEKTIEMRTCPYCKESLHEPYKKCDLCGWNAYEHRIFEKINK